MHGSQIPKLTILRPPPWDPFGTTRPARTRALSTTGTTTNTPRAHLTSKNGNPTVLGVKGSQVQILSSRRAKPQVMRLWLLTRVADSIRTAAAVRFGVENDRCHETSSTLPATVAAGTVLHTTATSAQHQGLVAAGDVDDVGSISDHIGTAAGKLA